MPQHASTRYTRLTHVAALNLIGSNLEDAEKGLTIDRINQQGQILSTNFFQNWIRKPEIKATACDPFVRTVEFNAVTVPQGPVQRYAPRFISQAYVSFELHDIAQLSTKIVQWSYSFESNRLGYAKYKRPPAAAGDCHPAYSEPEPDFPQEPILPQESETSWSSPGTGRDFYASADYGRGSARANRQVSAIAPSTALDSRSEGYRPDGSYGPIAAIYSDYGSSTANVRGSAVKVRRVRVNKLAVLPGHKLKKIRTARS
jgi:hypothetical protein